MELDHIAVAGACLEAAAAHVEEALGVALQSGGEHQRFGTHNRLLGLADGLYLEAIAIDPCAPDPDRPRWFDGCHRTHGSERPDRLRWGDRPRWRCWRSWASAMRPLSAKPWATVKLESMM